MLGPLVLLAWLVVCSYCTPPSAVAQPTGERDGGYAPPVHLANLEHKPITESSGIAASRRNSGLFWTHNDSGDEPLIYAFDRRGKHRGVWRVLGAKAVDWEDMAVGPGPNRRVQYLYLGDIGDNSKTREELIVYRVVEPSVSSGDSSSQQKPRATLHGRSLHSHQGERRTCGRL